MILLTSISSPLIVARFAPGLQAPPEEQPASPLFGRILVPVADARAQEHLLSLAGLLARAGGSKLMVVGVARASGGRDSSFVVRRDQLERVHAVLDDPDAQLEVIPRLAGSYAQGILHTSVERGASLIVMGWRGRRTLKDSVLGSVLDVVIWGSDTPVLVGKLSRPLNGMQRVLLIVPPRAVVSGIMRRILEANLMLSKVLNVPLEILADRDYLQQIEALLAAIPTDRELTLTPLRGALKINQIEKDNESDLIVIPGFGSRQRVLATLGSFPERLAASFKGNLLILHFDK
jgi:nucleotide-binding universal stress UspA family protein